MNELSFDDVMAPAGIQPATGAIVPKAGEISFDDALAPMQRPAPDESEEIPADTFISRSVQAVKEAGKAIATEPIAAAKGSVKALASGAVDLAGLAIKGLSGLATAAVGYGYNQPQYDLNTGMKSAEEFTSKVREFASAATHVNLAVEGKEEEAMGNLLMIIPDAIKSAGDTVYEKTGSALAGAGTQALLTLLTLKPGVVSKSLGAMKRGPKDLVRTKIEPVVDEMAVTNPDGVKAMAEHVKEADPELAQTLLDKLEKEITPEEAVKVGEKVAKPKVRLSYDEAGKPVFRPVEEIAADISKAMEVAEIEVNKLPNNISVEGRPVAEAGPVTAPQVEEAFQMAGVVDLGQKVLEGKLKEYATELMQTFAPELTGDKGKAAGAVIASNIAKQMQKDSKYVHRTAVRQKFWNERGPKAGMEFLNEYEKNHPMSDPALQHAAEGYRVWNAEILANEKALGLHEDVAASDTYMYHIFEKGEEVSQLMVKMYGKKWADPGFTKDRTFEMYQQAVKAGFKPRFTNPEDIMLARQHASDVAEMKVETLREMERHSMATRAKEVPRGWTGAQMRSPNGTMYWIHPDAVPVLNNAFNTKSLWEMGGMRGDAFRGAMWLKNTMVPFELGFSLFHPLHVLTIDNATGMVRASKELLSGQSNPLKWMAQMTGEILYNGMLPKIYSRSGMQLFKVFKGLVKDSDLTAADRQSLTYMAEGGFVPEMSSQYKTNARESFQKAIQERSPTAVFKAPLAAMSLLQKPFFEIWIPSLKIASYLKDVQTAIKTDPSLLTDPLKRKVNFRKLAKSIDNRYGEMAYNTLFWNKWVKDIGVASTLSLGWQLGFLREYGGAVGQLTKAMADPKSISRKLREGDMDKAMFTLFYSTQALMYGGLMTWYFTGQQPDGILDYTYPRIGTKPDGSPDRVGTMFYPKEFVSIGKHIQHEGLVSGLGHLVTNKGSGVMSTVAQWASGVNDFGEEIRDPDASAFKQLAQTVNATLKDMEPISIAAIRKGESPVLAVAGFSRAPKYITMSDTEAAIRNTYQKYYGAKQTPFEKAEASEDTRKLRQLDAEGNDEEYGKLLDKMEEKYQLSPKEFRRLENRLSDSEDPTISMFKRMSWQQQTKLLDRMTDEERELYLPSSNVEHVRYDYESPQERKHGTR